MKGKARAPNEWHASPLLCLLVLVEEAGLFFWEARFVEHDTMTARILKGESFERWLTVSTGDEQLFAHKISQNSLLASLIQTM
jgi:hypothetical protein